MKDLQKLTGAKILSKKEQQMIKGGQYCLSINDCGWHAKCVDSTCRPTEPSDYLD